MCFSPSGTWFFDGAVMGLDSHCGDSSSPGHPIVKRLRAGEEKWRFPATPGRTLCGCVPCLSTIPPFLKKSSGETPPLTHFVPRFSWVPPTDLQATRFILFALPYRLSCSGSPAYPAPCLPSPESRQRFSSSSRPGDGQDFRDCRRKSPRRQATSEPRLFSSSPCSGLPHRSHWRPLARVQETLPAMLFPAHLAHHA